MNTDHTSKSNSGNPSSKLIIGIVLALLVVAGIWFYTQKGAPTPEASPQPIASSSTDAGATPSPADSAAAPTTGIDLTPGPDGLSKATVSIKTAKGDIQFKFYSKDAPNTTQRMVELIQKGFYNGLTFHRVESWVIQGGDPTGTGTGGSGQRLKAEFNLRKHREGTVGMARSMDPDSADSQFYITFTTQPHLDNNYTVFGQVTQGMDIVRKIQKGDVMTTVSVQ